MSALTPLTKAQWNISTHTNTLTCVSYKVHIKGRPQCLCVCLMSPLIQPGPRHTHMPTTCTRVCLSVCVYICVCVRVELMCVHMFHLEGTALNFLLGYHFVSHSLFVCSHWCTSLTEVWRWRQWDTVGHPDHIHEQENLRQPRQNPKV